MESTVSPKQAANIEELPRPKVTLYSKYIKRVLDILLSGAAIIVLSPLLVTVYILELLIHGRPALYTAIRPGKDEKPIKMRKFRSMTNERDENGVLLPENLRLTGFGRLLRRTSIDELPELFLILSGAMSIVGPRPLHPQYLERYSPRHRTRQLVRPGLACVRIKRSHDDVIPQTWTWNDQFENDVWYIQNVSLCVDMRMVLAIAKAVIVGSEARADDTRVEYDGRNIDETHSRYELADQAKEKQL